MSVQNNKLIALFMGAEDMQTYLSFKHIKHDSLPIKGQWYYMFTELQYDKSWDWLMPVVEKIEQLLPDDSIITIEHKRCYIPTIYNEITIEGNADTKLRATYNAVIGFIRWYNKNIKVT